MNHRFAFVLLIAVCLGVSYHAFAGMRAGRAGGRGGAQPNLAQKPLVVPEGYQKVVVTVELPGTGQPGAPGKGRGAGEKQDARGPQRAGEGRQGGSEGGRATRGSMRGGRMARRGGAGGGPGGHGAGCPQTEVGNLLALSLRQPHGCIVGSVSGKGPAGKAGIKPGDSIVEADGNLVTCPSTFVPYLGLTEKPRKVKLTLLRPKAALGRAEGKPAPANAKPVPQPKGKKADSRSPKGK